jgi:hypothetical protein
MRKVILKPVLAVSVSLVSLYPLAWILASKGLLGESEFGYYGDFNVAKHAIESSRSIESMEYFRYEDVTLEWFYFALRIRSGREILLAFTGNTDVHTACFNTKGVLVEHPDGEYWQVYDLKSYSDLLKERTLKLRGVTDLIQEADVVAPVFEANYSNASIPRCTYIGQEFRSFLILQLCDARSRGWPCLSWPGWSHRKP